MKLKQEIDLFVSNMAERLDTPIEGLHVLLNDCHGDERGWLGELVPGGTAHQDLRDGFGNLYISVAKGQGIARAGHYHYRQSEVFFTITGSALWAFRDYREKSSSSGKLYAVVISDTDISGNLPTHYIGKDSMPGIVVPSGVYHVYWTLSDKPVRVVCVSTTEHDDTDYVRTRPHEVEGLAGIVREYGITL